MLRRRASVLGAATLLLAGSAMAASPATPASSLPRDAGLRWVSSSAGQTLDPASRLRLARSAADRAGLAEVGLDFRDVYGLIHAETSWVPRDGKGKNGVTSEGLAQFEPATARAVGLRDPQDAVQAVHAAARLLREAAVWSAQRIGGLGLSAQQRAAKLREGVSIYYNLSSQARSAWNGLNTDRLPVETQRHIRNLRAGAAQADQLNARLGGPSLPPLPPEELTRVATTRRAAPQPAGTIEWSGSGGEGPNAGRRSYVVLSDGTVRPQKNGEVPAGAIQWTKRGKG
ncbi:hypothetical protein H8N03_16825 [Ramlibacter sp. USB13]|uniref:Lytic transglycosylase domain-containing protein n=1 Tax=Ramlibacter cellulosilyticus TaxID=2764187 RepID=A0A923SC64_9BURK|nr:hypothetical protein [Ramlibacter cellulosilyticus]MBC5784615.1 hypothetical protein [Ramlibacter cellulosilyticus]